MQPNFQMRVSCALGSLVGRLHEGLGGFVESFALGSTVHQDESSDSELLAGLGNGFHPAGLLGSLSVLVLLLCHNVSLDADEILLGHSALGVHLSAVPNLAHGAGLAF